jgi:hypothetical protein
VKFVENLKGLEKELFAYKKDDVHIDDELLKSAVRMVLTEWARDARVAELYEGALPYIFPPKNN